MNGSIPDHIDENRAAVLLGMPQSELRRYSRASGLGHVESDDKGQKVVFTYEELRRNLPARRAIFEVRSRIEG